MHPSEPDPLLARFAVKSVRSLSSSAGLEGAPFECTLYFDGVRLAHVSDDGRGGAYRYDFMASSGHHRDPGPLGRAAVEVARQYLRARPVTDESFATLYDGPAEESDLDSVVARLADEYEHLQMLKRYCRTKTLYQIPGDDPPGSWRALATRYRPELAADIRGDCGEQVRILNEELRIPKAAFPSKAS